MRPHRVGGARRRLVFLCGVVPVVLTAVLAVFRPGFLPRLDDTVYDTVMRSGGTQPPGDRVVIVDVDERSLATVGQWPWRRDVVGRLIAQLQNMGASAIALDIIFAESRSLRRARNLRHRLGSSRAADAGRCAGRGAAQGSRAVLGYGLTFDRAASEPGSCVLHPVALVVIHPAEETGDAPYFHATGVVCSLPMLAQAGGASGFLNAAPDSDGILRRVPLLAEHGGRVYPSLALAAVAAATGARDMALRVTNVNASSLTFGDRVVPLDGKSNLLVRYRGKKGTFPRLSAADVLSGRVQRGDAAQQDRVRRDDRARNAGSRRDAARYAVCRRGSAGERRGQPAREVLHPPGAARDDARQPAGHHYRPGRRGAGRENGRRLRSAWQPRRHRRAVVGGRVAALGPRRVPLAPVPDHRRGVRSGGHDVRQGHGRAQAGRHRGPRQDRRAALDGADAAVADRSPGRRNRPSFTQDPGVREAPRGAARPAPGLPRVPDAGADRSALQPRAAARHRQGRDSRSHPQQARRAHAGRARRDANSIPFSAGTSF